MYAGMDRLDIGLILLPAGGGGGDAHQRSQFESFKFLAEIATGLFKNF